jgi:glucokinase
MHLHRAKRRPQTNVPLQTSPRPPSATALAQSKSRTTLHSRRPYFIGVDVGGTKVAAGVVAGNGEILRKNRVPMTARKSAAEGFTCVMSAINALLEDSATRTGMGGIGICSPGPLDPRTGVVINPPNLPCWRNFPLAAQISRRYSVPVRVENDANAAALAESIWGAGHGYSNIFYTTIGTGIGTGIILDGKIFNGRTGAAPEGGHLTIDYHGPRCACGKHGCIEGLAAGPAIAQRARLQLSKADAHNSPMLALAGGRIRAVTPEIVVQAYEAGDSIAREVLRETVTFLTIWLGNVIDLLDPGVILFGGGLARAFQPFFEEIRSGLPKHCINPHPKAIPILLARYAEDAGIAGGAALCHGRE